jgi:hypothetical protein
MQPLSRCRCDEGIHPVVGTTEEVVESVYAHSMSERNESRIKRLKTAAEGEKKIAGVYFASGEQ